MHADDNNEYKQKQLKTEENVRYKDSE